MRILTAIMFTDIEGFTSLMQRDEAKAIRLLERHKKIFLQCTEQYKGRVIKYIGDGTLTIFNSVFDAISCAVAMQQAFQKSPVIPVRIGIHTGEVLFEKKDVIGDAVNLASRIQTKGIAGSVLVSEKVHEELINHPEIATEQLGAFQLKNVVNPVHLYAIVAKGLKVPAKDAMAAKENDQPAAAVFLKGRFTFPGFFGKNRMLIAVCILIVIVTSVLIFSNSFTSNANADEKKTIGIRPFIYNGPDSNNYLPEGMAREFMSLLCANPDLAVMKVSPGERNLGEEDFVKKISGNHGGYILEGSIQTNKNKLRILAELRDLETGKTVWSIPYNTESNDVIDVQQQAAYHISKELCKWLGKENPEMLPKKDTDPEASVLYNKARYAQKKRDPASIREAGYFFVKALEKNPAYALAYSGICDNYVLLIDHGYMPYDSGINEARIALNQALRLDSNNAEVRASYAIFLTTLEGRRKDAMHELQVALNLDSGYQEAHQWYAVELVAAGQFDAAIDHINKALSIDPFSERIWDQKVMILTYARRFREAVNMKDSLQKNYPDKTLNLYMDFITECYSRLGKMDSALISANGIGGEFSEFWQLYLKGDATKIRQLIQRELNTGNPDNEILATYYTALGQHTDALKCLENALAGKEYSWLKFLNVAPAWDPLRQEPGFQMLLMKLGF